MDRFQELTLAEEEALELVVLHYYGEIEDSIKFGDIHEGYCSIEELKTHVKKELRNNLIKKLQDEYGDDCKELVFSIVEVYTTVAMQKQDDYFPSEEKIIEAMPIRSLLK